MDKRPANLSGQVAEAIAIKILDGTFAPGSVMPTEGELGQLTGVSRTTLRSAMQSLAAKGMVDIGPSRGTRVLPRSRWNLLDGDVIEWRLQLGVTEDLVRELYELRECFEPRAGALAAERGSPDQHARIAAAMQDLRDSRTADEATATAADVKFHMEILESCGNQFLASLAGTLQAVLQISFRIARRRKTLSADDIDRHAEIAAAILAQDPAAAEAATRSLLSSSKQVQMDAVADLERSTRVSRTLARTLGR